MAKTYDHQTFHAEVNGNYYGFYCRTTRTRNGFCHTVEIYTHGGSPYQATKVSYCNRTWESFTYETALSRAIEKCPKADQSELRATLIDRTRKEEHEKCEKFLKAFETGWNALTDENKERVAKTVGDIETEGQAQAALGLVQLAALMQ